MQTSETISKSKMIGATKWSLITEVATKIISPFVNIVLARLLLPEAFGAVATITMVTSFAEVFTDAGFQKYIIQHEFKDCKSFDDGVQVAFWSNFALSVLIFAVLCIFINPISEAVGSPQLNIGIMVASSAIILNSFSSIQLSVYKRELDFKTLFKLRIVIAFVPFVVTILLAIILKSFWALVIGTLASKVVQAVLLIIKSKVKIRLFYSIKILKEMFSFSAWTFLETIVIWLTTNIDIFLVGKMLNDYYLGLYKTSMTTVNSYLSIVSSAITSVLFASLSRYQNNPKEFQKVYFKFQKLLGILIVPMGVGLFVYSDLVTQILLGGEWMEASGFIGLWALLSCFTVLICYFASEVFRSMGKPKISMIYQVLYILILTPSVYMAGKQGFEVLYVVRSFTSLGFIASAFLFSQFLFNINIHKVLGNLLPQTISAFIMGACGFGFLMISKNIVWQIVSILLCVIIYFAIILQFKTIREELLTVEKVRALILKFKLGKLFKIQDNDLIREPKDKA